MNFKQTAKKSLINTGKAIALTSTALHNAPLSTRIMEIDAQIAELKEEKAELESRKISRPY